MMLRPIKSLRARWAATQRHMRLRIAVLGCVAVMLALSVSLMVSVQLVATTTERDLIEAGEWSAASSNANTAATLLESWNGANGSGRVQLIAVLDELSTQHAMLERTGVSYETTTLGELIDLAGEVMELEDPATFRFGQGPAALAPQFSALSEDLAESGRLRTTSTVTDLRGWSNWVQVVAGGSAILFIIVVVTQIFPLLRSMQRSMGKLRTWNDTAAAETRRRKLSRQVVEGLEVAANETAAYNVIARALGVAAEPYRAEMLLADSSRAHLRAAVVHPENGASGCGVVSPWSCPAVRRGTTQTFDDSSAIRACPHLTKHDEPCSAVCAPMTFMGEPMGVLHVTGTAGVAPDDEVVRDINMVAAESATRIGTLRAFARAELQAATDVLTGLPNRRATEDKLRVLIGEPDGGAAAVIEVVGLAALNDSRGKSAGDRALKVASEALLSAVREVDWCGRWNGAEFVVILPGMSAVGARDVVERIGTDITERLESADLVGLRTVVGIADTRRASTAHGMMSLIGEALSDARGELLGEPTSSEPQNKNLSDPQLSTP